MEDRPITFNLLHKDELTYEVAIRDAVPKDDVKGLREQIRKLGREVPSDDIEEFEGDLLPELATVRCKVEELERSTISAKPPITLKALNRVQALGHHIYHRLTRMHPDDEGTIAVHAELTERLMRILSKLDKLFSVFVSSRASRGFEDAEEEVAGAAGVEVAPTVHTPNETVRPVVTEPTPCPVMACAGKPSTVASLNLRFNGRSCVKAFLQRVDELSASRRISDTGLLASAVELFEGDALLWYRGIRDEATSWEQLKTFLIEEFLPFDYDRRLLKEIRNRTQGPNENISTYISIMYNYFSRLTRTLTEQEMFDIVSINVRPEYAVPLAMYSVSTLKELKRVCRVLEDSWQRANSFVEPPKPSSNSLAADLCCKAVSRPRVEANVTQRFCPRCQTDAHGWRECPSKRIVCFKCGTPDVTVLTCPSCSPRPSGSGSGATNSATGGSRPKN
jgi:hypothetical protein